MIRDIEEELLRWKNSAHRMPLIVRGARQTGKTYSIEKFGKYHFKNILTVNFELNPEAIICFKNLDPKKIIFSLNGLFDDPITPGATLLFLDEIQLCKQAIVSLRYFYEKMPDLHVIAAGSLLEFVLGDENFSMPVGRAEYLYFSPLNFREYLIAKETHGLLNCIQNSTSKEKIPAEIHARGINLAKEYAIVGGMPQVVRAFVTDENLNTAKHLQTQVINTYRDDFGKYGPRLNHQILESLFSKAHFLVAKQFKFRDVNPDIQAAQIKPSLNALLKAGIYHPVFMSTTMALPLNASINYKKFKLLSLDIGLLNNMGKLDSDIILNDNFQQLHQGRLCEQYVGQELINYLPRTESPELFYWDRAKKNSMAELDYLTVINGKIIPIEVKSGKTGRLKSLKLFLEENKNSDYVSQIGVKISQDNLEFKDNILSIPLYMISELERLLSEVQ
jgi:predicted AAA+ superfamily ATPase